MGKQDQPFIGPIHATERLPPCTREKHHPVADELPHVIWKSHHGLVDDMRQPLVLAGEKSEIHAERDAFKGAVMRLVLTLVLIPPLVTRAIRLRRPPLAQNGLIFTLAEIYERLITHRG